MSETLTPQPGNHDPQQPLFRQVQGTYEQTPRYEEPPVFEPFVMPEKPPKLEEMTADQMLSVALQEHLSPDIYGHFSQKREDFTKTYSWTPYSEAEATMAIGGGLGNYLLGARTRGGMSAVRDVLFDVDRYRVQAVDAIDTLRLVQDVRSGEFNTEWARGNTHVRKVLARAVIARNSLNLFEWQRPYDKKTREIKANRKFATALQAITDKLANLDDEHMKTLLDRTLRQQQARLSFLSKQLDKAEADDKTSDLIAAYKASD